MKKFVLFTIITAMLFTLIPYAAFASENTDLGRDFSVYLSGPDKSSQKSTLNMTGSPIIYGNTVVQSGTFLLTKTWDEHNIEDGMLYPNDGVVLSDAVSGWARNQILSYGIIAPQADYTVQLPQISDKTFPELEQKGILDVHNKEVTVSENGWYTYINIAGNPNTLTIDTTGGKTLHIRADKFDINGRINIIGNGKVYLYIDEIVFGGKVIMNAEFIDKDNTVFGNSEQLFVYLSNKVAVPVFNATTRIAGSIFAPNSNLDLGGDVQIVGNIYTTKMLLYSNSAKVTGLVYVPNANVVMGGSALLNGTLIAKTLEMANSAVINKADYPGYDFIIDDVDDEDPQDPQDPQDPTYHNGLLGEYYDAAEFVNESALRMKRIDPKVAYNWGYGSPHAVIEPETFAVRWTGYIKPEVTSNYTFKTYSDDGVKLTIDGKTLIDRWGLVDLEYTIAGETVYLEAGKYYPVTLEYQQIPLNSTIFLFWEAADVPMSLVPESVFYVDQEIYEEYINPKFLNVLEKAGNGLRNAFFTLDENGEKVQEYTEYNNVSYYWGYNAPGSITEDVFYGEMNGYIETLFTEELTIKFIVDDAIRVWIDDELVIDEWDAHDLEAFTYTFNAVAGQKYKIRIEYKDMILSATCVMCWYGPSLEYMDVPVKFLYAD